jgi:serine phosphatase RsbU (regulator of sigma subunit)
MGNLNLIAELEKVWQMRYSNTKKANLESNKLYEVAVNENDIAGQMYALLYRAATSFLLSSDILLSDLLQCVDYFEKNPKEKGLTIAYNFTGNVFENIGKYNEAIHYCQKSVKAAQEINYAEGIGDSYNTLGIVYMRIGDYLNSEKSFQKALQIRMENEMFAAAASSYNLLGRVNTLKRNFEEALSNYQKSLELRINHGHTGAIPWSQLGLGSLFLEMGRLDDSETYFTKAIDAAKKNNDERCLMHCNYGLGKLFSIQNNGSKSVEHLEKALSVAEKMDAKAVMADIYQVLSEVNTQNQDFQNALTNFRKYHNLKEEILNTETHNQLKNQEIAFAVERSQKEAEIYQLKHVELKKAYDILEEKNKQITDSINYASSIQSALLPDMEALQNFFSDSFILFKPKDIVSGDFYWIQPLGNKILITAADCTGHGVPGAFMSVLGISLLDDIVNKNGVIKPNEILFELRAKIIHALNQHKEKDKKDGMDMALCLFDFDGHKGYYSGSYNPLYIIRNNEFEQIKADRMPIGLHIKDNMPFSEHEFSFDKGDQFYMFSDGYADQFGGPNERKIKSKKFQELLLENSGQAGQIQRDALDNYFETWRGEMEQIDDVIVIGLKI